MARLLHQQKKTFLFQLKQSNREKLDAKLRLDRLDIQKENLRLERDMLKKDLNEANTEKSKKITSLVGRRGLVDLFILFKSTYGTKGPEIESPWRI